MTTDELLAEIEEVKRQCDQYSDARKHTFTLSVESTVRLARIVRAADVMEKEIERGTCYCCHSAIHWSAVDYRIARDGG